MKSTKTAKNTKNQSVITTSDSVNWNAKYYREKAMKFINSASYSAPSTPVSASASPIEIAKVMVAAKKVRHNPRPVPTSPRIVMIGGVPHVKRDGKLVAMIPASKSKKWDIIEG